MRSKTVNLSEERTWEKEAQVEKVIMRLASLEETEKGTHAAVLLKQKHWTRCSFSVFVGNLSTFKDKMVMSQRFYPQDAHSLISVDEAYRFLQNKRMEKQMLAKTKKSNEPEPNNEMEEEEAGLSTELLRKKRPGRIKGETKQNVQSKPVDYAVVSTFIGLLYSYS